MPLPGNRTVVYISRSNIDGDAGALEHLRKQCVFDNARLEITGALYYDHEMFLQVLEGSDAALSTLLTSIKADTRHHDMRILLDEAGKGRLFSKWSMKFVSGLADQALSRDISYEHLAKADPADVGYAALLLSLA